MSKGEEKVIASNRRARHEYEVLETFEAGIVLVGPEVKSLREARANLGDAYGVVRKGECWLEKLHITQEIVKVLQDKAQALTGERRRKSKTVPEQLVDADTIKDR